MKTSKESISKDLVVVGGGLAGCFSAIAAKRISPDSTVILLERYGFLGGMATAGYVFPFMRYHTRMKNGTTKRLVGGLFQEFTDIMANNGYMVTKHVRNGFYSRFEPEMAKCILDRMILDAGVELLFHGLVNQVDVRGCGEVQKEIKTLTVQTKAGPLAIGVKLVIDATGDADVIYHSGGAWEMGRKTDGLVQPATLNFRMGRVGPIKPTRHHITKKIKMEKQKGNPLTPRDDCLMFTAGKNRFHFNQTRVAGYDFTDPFQMTDAELEGRKQAKRFIDFLQSKIFGFKKRSTVVGIGSQLGIRESRRIIGDYKLTEEDLMDCVQFNDRIALGNYPVDIHDPKGTARTDIRRIPNGKWYSIPWRALLPKGMKNVIVAGRPISTTHEAHSAIRVMPICSAIGHAAGIGMGLALKKNLDPRDVDVSHIQEQLKKQGAILE